MTVNGAPYVTHVETYEAPTEPGEHVYYVPPLLTDPIGWDDAVRAYRRISHARSLIRGAAFLLGL